jgi:hypothetical protein
MTDIPRAVLSERFEEHVAGRQLIAAVFLTFTFDPEFFEQQVLPVFLDVPTSHSEAIRRVQLEDALKDVRHRVAVYYDQNGLTPDAKSARLDISRVPIRHPTGIFHPKNVFALVEETEPDVDGYRAQSLIVACMSANLTRAGWWENVEVCHIEEIGEGESSSDQLIAHYVTALCAKQLIQELRRDEPDFFREHRDETRRLEEQLGVAETLRNALTVGGEALMPEFLDWFEAWFLKRARPIAEEVE